jgi:signal transduction protein with GAF and PtsI domain
MIYSIFFSSGLALGFVAGIATWAVCHHIGRKLAAAEHQKLIAKIRTDAVIEKKRIDDAMAKFRASFPEMDEQHKVILEKEVSGVFSSRNRG